MFAPMVSVILCLSFLDVWSLSYFAGSSFHLVTYNATNGNVISQGTAEGYADNR
jgi:hypothetical protein